MRELTTFLDRREQAKESRSDQQGPAIIPVFYRLDVQCGGEGLYAHGTNTGRIIFDEGFFAEERLEEMPESKATRYMKLLVGEFTGIENEEEAMNELGLVSDADKTDCRARRQRLLERIVDTVVKKVAELSDKALTAAASCAVLWYSCVEE